MSGQPRLLLDMVRDGIAAKGDAEILTFLSIAKDGAVEEETRSYSQIWRNGERIRKQLLREGMREGDRFALFMKNHPEFVDAMVGSAMAGTIFVPVDPGTGSERLSKMLRFSECRGIIIADYLLEALIESVPQLPNLEWIWVLGDTAVNERDVRVTALDAILASEAESFEPCVIDPALPMQIIFTSGSTGDPKGIVSPHARFASVAAAGPIMGLCADDRPYTGLSLTHANAQFITLGASLGMGLHCFISRQFTKSRLWELLNRYRCTVFNLLGGMTIAIYSEPPCRWDRDHSVRFVISAGMSAPLWTPFSERYGINICEFYGAAEGGLTLNRVGEGPVGSIGKAVAPLVCALLDDEDNEVAAGEIGQICFRDESGNPPPVSYFENHEASAEKTAGGWFRSGDMGWKDEQGWLYFSHRAGDAVRRNGGFVTITDVEAHLATLDSIEDVHVYGLPLSTNAPGECEVVAAIVAKDSAANIFKHCDSISDANSRPSFLQFVDEIPKTGSQKPLARILAEMVKSGVSKLVTRDGLAELDDKLTR